MATRGGFRQIGSGGGIRQIQHVNTGRIYNEAGISSISGLGNYPTGASTYRAVKATPAGPDDGFIMVSVYGLRPTSPGSPGLESGPAYVWRTTVRHKQELLDGLYDIRNSIGSGLGSDEKGEEYLDVMTIETGYEWLEIVTVRVTT